MNVLVVGNGNMGRNHVRVLREIGHDVQTLDPSNAVAADHYMLSFELIAWTDVVCVAVPIDELARIAEAWLKRGKDVLVEKPGATDLDTLAYLHQVAVEEERHLAVGYTERHNPAVVALQWWLPRVGELRHIAIRRLGYVDSALDPVLNLAVHDLDVLASLGMNVWLESKISTEHHVAALLSGQRVTAFDPDVFSVSLEASHLHPVKIRDIEVIGTQGVLQCDYQRQTLGYFGHDGHLRADLPVDAGEPLEREWRAFFNGEGSDGIAALTIAEQMVGAETPARIAAS